MAAPAALRPVTAYAATPSGLRRRRDGPALAAGVAPQQGHQSIQSSVDGLAAQALCLVAVVIEIDLERGAVHGDLPLNMALD